MHKCVSFTRKNPLEKQNIKTQFKMRWQKLQIIKNEQLEITPRRGKVHYTYVHNNNKTVCTLRSNIIYHYFISFFSNTTVQVFCENELSNLSKKINN